MELKEIYIELKSEHIPRSKLRGVASEYKIIYYLTIELLRSKLRGSFNSIFYLDNGLLNSTIIAES